MVLKIDYDTEKLQKVTYDVMKITSPIMRHQNDATRFFYFQAPPLAKSWLRSWSQYVIIIQQKYHTFTAFSCTFLSYS